jgi:hypothetical protein
MKNHRLFVIRKHPPSADVPHEHFEWWSYDHQTPDDMDNALEIPVQPGDVIADGSRLDPALFNEFHGGTLRRLHGHEPEKLYDLLDEGARVTVPEHVAPAEPDHETVFQPEFRRIVSRPKPEALEIAVATARLENATEIRRAGQEKRPPSLKAEPARAYWAEVRTPDRRVKRAVFPQAQLVHVFEGGSPDLATEDAHVLKEGDVLMGRKHLGSGRPGAAPPVRLGGQP